MTTSASALAYIESTRADWQADPATKPQLFLIGKLKSKRVHDLPAETYPEISKGTADFIIRHLLECPEKSTPKPVVETVTVKAHTRKPRSKATTKPKLVPTAIGQVLTTSTEDPKLVAIRALIAINGDPAATLTGIKSILSA